MFHEGGQLLAWRGLAEPTMKLHSLLHDATRLAAAGPAARRFALRAWLGAPVVRASLAVAGLQRTLRWVEAVPAPASRGAGVVGVEEGEALVRAVFRRHFVGGECLPQSLVQYLLHRRDGLPVRFVMGVQRDRGAIDAHAWVEAAEPRGVYAPIFASGPVSMGPQAAPNPGPPSAGLEARAA
jgi:hypothetical protein